MSNVASSSEGRAKAPHEDHDTNADLKIMRMNLKWFNASKGFGFLVPDDETFDAFFHVTILQDAGLNSAGEGAVFDCELYDSDKGKQVKRIVNVISAGQSPIPHPSEQPQVQQEELLLKGLVKWYKQEKGFGFIVADDGHKDIFVHKTLLTKHEIDTLTEGQRVKVTAKIVNKGREATSIAILKHG